MPAVRIALSALILSLGLLVCTSPAAFAHHQDPNLNSDGDSLSNYDDPCPYDPAENCVGAADSDGDGYQRYQDPCDNNSHNEQCDRDGDGIPDNPPYDPCPDTATGHMLGSDQPLPQQDPYICQKTPPPTPGSPAAAPPTDPAVVNSVGNPALHPRGLEITKFRLAPGQTLESIFGSGLKFDVGCSERCDMTLGFAWRHGTNYSGTTTQRVGPRGARVKVHAPRHKRRARRSTAEARSSQVSSLAEGDATIHGFRNVGALQSARPSQPGGFVKRSPEVTLTVNIVASVDSAGTASAVASATRVAETLQDTASFVNSGQQRTLAVFWHSSARRLSSRCALSAPLPNAGIQGGLLLGFLASADVCGVARSYSRIARLLLTPRLAWKYYRTYTGLVHRQFALDVCDWVVFVGGRKVSFSYRPRGGRCF